MPRKAVWTTLLLTVAMLPAIASAQSPKPFECNGNEGDGEISFGGRYNRSYFAKGEWSRSCVEGEYDGDAEADFRVTDHPNGPTTCRADEPGGGVVFGYGRMDVSHDRYNESTVKFSCHLGGQLLFEGFLEGDVFDNRTRWTY